jgi:Sensors of blue-light using FAD
MDVATTEPTTGEVFRLIYRSRARIPQDGRRAELGELFSVARSNNKKQQVTGALLLKDDYFVQTLEGEEQVVRALFARIEQDPRHDDVELLETGTVSGRVFVRWAMAKVADEGTPDIPLIAHVEGISPAAPRGDATPEQEDVLTVMRQAARV